MKYILTINENKNQATIVPIDKNKKYPMNDVRDSLRFLLAGNKDINVIRVKKYALDNQRPSLNGINDTAVIIDSIERMYIKSGFEGDSQYVLTDEPFEDHNELLFSVTNKADVAEEKS